MKRVAIIGAGISGLSTAHFLKGKYCVKIFEKETRPGGLIKCVRERGGLFHTCGGHVFNSKRQDVLDWFWSFFDKDKEFSKAERNSCVFIDKGQSSLKYSEIPYPIENHVYLLEPELQRNFYSDLDEIDSVKGRDASFADYGNFGEFLRWRFGETLYRLYFQPYNQKVWRRDLASVPMSWMEGKLPMPTTQEMRENNKHHFKEKSFVHSSFWYEKQNGSQFLADRLADGLDISYDTNVNQVTYLADKKVWNINGEEFDYVVFCGNIKELCKMVSGVDISEFSEYIAALEYHGTTAVFCEIDKNPYSWIYQPSKCHRSHRIICTGNFAESNNATEMPNDRITATVEFTDEITKEEILEDLKKIPLNPKYINHRYNKYTYPIQDSSTRAKIQQLKSVLSPYNFFLTGRFADWEYYNMDVAIGASMDMVKRYNLL